MGAVPAEVVIATFYNFYPGLVRSAIPGAWDVASPAALLDARLQAADAALRDALGDDAVASDDMVWAAELARRAPPRAAPPRAAPCTRRTPGCRGRREPHLALWHAVTLLREFRGDGHIAALVLEGIDACESLVTHGAAGEGVALGVLQSSRAWPDDEWDAARGRLRDRGWLDDADTPTPAGAEAHDRVEQRTDEAAMAPWRHLGEADADRLRATVRVWSKSIVASGVLGGGLG